MHCVDLGESFQTHIYLQHLASIQPRTSPVKFSGTETVLVARPIPRHHAGRAHPPVVFHYGDCQTRKQRMHHGELSRTSTLRFRRACDEIGRELYRARSRLYRSQILQLNMRLKALVEIYTMHSFAPFRNRIPKARKTMGGKEPGPTPGKLARRSS